jgi:alpha-ketoglutarate-dependent taurine dioxygenase
MKNSENASFGKPILSTGMGRIIHAEHPLYEAQELVSLAEIVSKYGFLVVREAIMDFTAFEDFCGRFGKPVTYADKSIGYGYNVVVTLDGDDSPDKVITGRGPLPLHTDGILFDNRVDIVVLYCEECSGAESSQSSTIICDQKAALKTIDQEILHLILEKGIEYQITEKGYFSIQPDDWYSVAHYSMINGELVLRIALPFPDNCPSSWLTRVKGIDSKESQKILSELENHLRKPEYLYEHCWNPGDLLLIDNRHTLHGRNVVVGNRKLLNGQVVIDDSCYEK